MYFPIFILVSCRLRAPLSKESRASGGTRHPDGMSVSCESDEPGSVRESSRSDDATARLLFMMPVMLFLSLLRREAARSLLATIAQAVAVDAVPSRRSVSRQRHLRNGLAAILDVSSQVAWRPPLATLFYATRAGVQSELRYGLDELRRAATPSRSDLRRHRLLLAAVPSAVAALALVVRTRRNAGDGEPVAPPPEPAPVSGGE